MLIFIPNKTLKFQGLVMLNLTSCLLQSYILVFEILYWSARAAITMYHKLSGLSNRTLLSHCSEAISPSQGLSRVGSLWDL